MELKELKREVQDLEVLQEDVRRLREHWVRPLHKDTNSRLPFLRDFPMAVRTQLNKKLVVAHEHLQELEQSQLQEQLHRFSRNLISLKLMLLQDDRKKAKVFARKLLNDDSFTFKKALSETQEFEEKLQQFSEHYQDVNELLQKNLSLEDAVIFMELPHYIYLKNLKRTAQRQQRLARDLGRHLVALTKEASLKNVPHK